MEPVAVVDRLYTAFAARDGDAMAALYAPSGRFSDPVFPALTGAEAGAMWRMLTARADDLRIEHTPPTQQDGHVRTRWQAWYTFSATGRKVHNIIDADIVVEDGQITSHTDHFGFWRWSRQALGVPGLLLGWTPMLQGKVQKQADKGLRQFLARDGSGAASG